MSTPVVKSLLAGSCTVICSFRGSRFEWFQQIYSESAGELGRLICVPFDCGSQPNRTLVGLHHFPSAVHLLGDCISAF